MLCYILLQQGIHGSFLFVNNVSCGIKKEEMMGDFINSAPLFVVILLLVVGFALLVKGADFFVEGSSSVAKKLAVPSIIIGLTIVAMGTSLPETAVSVTASLVDNNTLAISNVVGSNIFNILMVLGIASAINPVSLIRENVIDIIILVVFSVVVWIFAATKKKISRREGIAMVAMYLVYAVYIILR